MSSKYKNIPLTISQCFVCDPSCVVISSGQTLTYKEKKSGNMHKDVDVM